MVSSSQIERNHGSGNARQDRPKGPAPQSTQILIQPGKLADEEQDRQIEIQEEDGLEKSLTENSNTNTMTENCSDVNDRYLNLTEYERQIRLANGIASESATNNS